MQKIDLLGTAGLTDKSRFELAKFENLSELSVTLSNKGILKATVPCINVNSNGAAACVYWQAAPPQCTGSGDDGSSCLHTSVSTQEFCQDRGKIVESDFDSLKGLCDLEAFRITSNSHGADCLSFCSSLTKLSSLKMYVFNCLSYTAHARAVQAGPSITPCSTSPASATR